jgi:quinohemoprotein ethanol dehydrogenase
MPQRQGWALPGSTTSANPAAARKPRRSSIDGVMYTSGTWGYVYAVDAATGRELWRYDPQPDYFAGRHPCCDLVNRGVAVWKGKVYVASVDGRLHALNAATGRENLGSRHHHRSQAALLQHGRAADRRQCGGHRQQRRRHGTWRRARLCLAYDLDSGAFKWRFYTVPPAVGQPYENPELAQADKTWDPHRKPEFNGGGTAWDGFAYDPALNLLYFGTANAAPYDLRQLGPAKLDSLYTASIIALDAATGRMAWYYQTTPRDSWDYDSVQK